MTVKQNLEFPLRRIKKNLNQKEINEKVKEVLENVGLSDALNKMPSQLSGGMRKRISLARTLVVDPMIMLYDEPTTGLDPVTSDEISSLINDVQKKYKTSSIIITHDIECARTTANRIIMLLDGEVYQEGELEKFEKSTDPSESNHSLNKNNMETHTQKFKVRLGLFIAGGLALFVIAIFIIGKQENLFDPVFKLTTTFYNVSGLEVGSNIRFSGINVGTVDNIKIINDSTVRVDMLIKKNVQQFIKSDCEAGIGSAGIIGDRILIITQGSSDAPLVKEGDNIDSKEPVETDAIMESMQITADNAAIISFQLAEIMININSGNGTLGRLIQDSTIAENINRTIMNLRKSSKGLNENMNAAKENFLFKGYYNRKRKSC